jgi:hypothetical protein
MLRLLRRTLLIGLAAFVGLVLVLVTLAYLFEDQVKAKLVDELNAHLLAPLHQNGIELTLVKRFPQASLRIRDVYMQEVRTDEQPADTLLYAKDLYLEFSLFDLITGDYTVHDIHGQDVKLYPGLDTKGAENWLVWRTDSSGTGQENRTAIDLRKVTFDGLSTRFRDGRSGLEVAATSKRSTFALRFRDDGSTLALNGDVWLRHWSDRSGTRLADRKADINLHMLFGGADGAFHIDKGELFFGKTPLNVTLAVLRNGQGQTLDLRANGFGLDLATVVELLPESMHHALRRYGLDGNADIAIHYAGPLDGAGPSLSAGMKLREGRFTERASGTVFRQVQGELSVDLTPQGTPKKLVVKGFSANSSSGPVGGSMELQGLKNAKVTAEMHGDLELADLLRFIRVDTLEQVGGRLKAEAHIHGRVRDVADLRASDLRSLALSGTVSLRNATLKLKGLRHRVQDLNADLALDGNDATVHDLRFDLQGNAMHLNGTLRNLMPYLLFHDQRLAIEASGSSPKIDLASLLVGRNTSPTATDADYRFTLPALIDLDLKTDIGELTMEDFSAQRITGTIRLKDQRLTISPLAFHTADGSVSGSLRLDGTVADAYPLAIDAELNGIDVTKLFSEFREFGQTFITHTEIKGTGDAQLTFTAPLRPDFSLDEDRLHCVADVVLNHGELNNHPSLMAVADHLQKNKLVSPFVDVDALRTQFRHVTFARLENRIEIKDRQVHLPLMTVSCNVMDLEVTGTHGFDGAVDDHLNFRLGDLFRTAQSGDDEFGPIIDDGTGLRIFLHMYGTTDDLQFGNDGAMAAAKRKEKMKQETAELKDILKSVVTGDRTASAALPPPQQGKITVDWNGPEAPPAQATAPKPKKGLGRLLEKSDKDDGQETIKIE